MIAIPTPTRSIGHSMGSRSDPLREPRMGRDPKGGRRCWTRVPYALSGGVAGNGASYGAGSAHNLLSAAEPLILSDRPPYR